MLIHKLEIMMNPFLFLDKEIVFQSKVEKKIVGFKRNPCRKFILIQSVLD